ncbi:hypothetical protein OUZ56_030669 [Daphnia magna]|uniref:Uncharacterized protein n=1 Tax=Daphnia magna TaxID=35525 RepID=A0ABQ9ZRZ7_9CRUS|nr:hypothetical protein OUZ56_030669 [Daphnia magna]
MPQRKNKTKNYKERKKKGGDGFKGPCRPDGKRQHIKNEEEGKRQLAIFSIEPAKEEPFQQQRLAVILVGIAASLPPAQDVVLVRLS